MKSLVKRFLYSPTCGKMLNWIERRVPFVRHWHTFQYEQRMARATPFERSFCGIFTSFEDAISAVPEGRKIGYDHPESARLLGESGPPLASDYPMLYWLARLLQKSRFIFDYGGYVGLSFYSYQPYLDYSPELRWLIFDLPEVIALGQEIARRRDPTRRVCFTNDFTDANGADVFIGQGSLQFAEEPLSTLLAKLDRKPQHLLINRTPLSEAAPFVTLHNMGPALCPYRIFNRLQFVESITVLGYELKDSWSNPDLGCYIPYHADRFLSAFSGLYFRAKS
jgi:putative methyltransferase (TIGR04325 family)